MLSRKLLSSVAVGVLSVALVPVTWARTHAHQPTKTATPAKLVTQAPTKTVKTSIKPSGKTAVKPSMSKRTVHSKMTSRHASSRRLATHRVTSRKMSSRVTTHGKVPSKKLVSSHKTVPSKLTTKRPINSKLVRKPTMVK